MEMQSLAESDSGRDLLRLLSQYCTQQLLLQQAASASAVARGLYGPIGAGREAQQAAADPPPPSPSTSQQQMSAPSPYCLLVRPAPQISVVNSTVVAAASAAVQLQQPQLLQPQLQQQRQIPGVPMIYNTPQTTALYTNAVAAASAAFQLQLLQQQQQQITSISMMPRYPGYTGYNTSFNNPQSLPGIAPQQLYNFQRIFAPFLTPHLSQPQWR